jgi:hypothetical protein
MFGNPHDIWIEYRLREKNEVQSSSHEEAKGGKQQRSGGNHDASNKCIENH